MRIEDAKEKLQEAIIPIVQQFFDETGIRIVNIEINHVKESGHSVGYRQITMSKFGIHFALDYER